MQPKQFDIIADTDGVTVPNRNLRKGITIQL